MLTAPTAPAIPAVLVHHLLDDPSNVLVWLPLINEVDVAYGGLTAAQADCPDIIPIFTHEQARLYVRSNYDHVPTAADAMATALRSDILRGRL